MRIEASFDCMAITSLLQEWTPGPTKGEVHLLAYLSWLLSVYQHRGSGAADWGYSFAATPTGVPFSQELDDSMTSLLAMGTLASVDANLQLTNEGMQGYHNLSTLTYLKQRFTFLDASAAILLAMPVGMVRSALAINASAATVASYSTSRMLGSESALTRLYYHFSLLADALDAARDSLLAAAVLWLTYLIGEESIGYERPIS